MPEQNIKLVIEYEGTAYVGWQSQAQGRTIQQTITEAVRRTTGQVVKLEGAGRTDAGVHALGQVANFKIDHRLEPERYSEALNFYLPDDILIRRSELAPPNFHARFGATARRYRYLVSTGKSAIYRHLRHRCPARLDYNLLQRAAAVAVGDHDFAAFCVVASRKENNRCIIQYSRWFRFGDLLVYEIRGNRFLHSMVRSLVGAMLNLAIEEPDQNKRNLTLDQFSDIINVPTEERVAFTAPACGLYLVKVVY